MRYSVPRDETLRREWIRKIPNANFNPTKYTCVCEKNHLTVEEVSSTSGSRHYFLGSGVTIASLSDAETLP